ncbi:MAG: DUF4376 domain-containing protein [Pseudomonadota bacterium]
MSVTTNRDLLVLVAQGAAGFDLPAEFDGIPLHHLRCVDGKVIDASATTSFWIDEGGEKHVVQIDGWRQLDCGIDDQLIRTETGWKVSTQADQIAADRAAMWEAIKTERDSRKAGGFKVKVGSADKWFHSDADSRIQHLGLKDKARDLLAAGGAMTDKITILGQPVKWKTMDGSFVEVTAQVAFDIVAAAGDLDAQLFAAAETHRATMEASPDPASYGLATGWPATFGG